VIDMRVNRLFFDRPTVQRAVDKAKRKVLSRAGAFIRTTAKHSIRKRKGTSPPGQPPYSHEGSLRRLIFFGYDKATDSVVVGPIGFGHGRAPSLLEFGGSTKTKRSLRVRVARPGRDKRGRFTKGRYRRIKAGAVLRYMPRPFMGPALERERPSLPKRWANSVRG
jgi:hypothetical protein